jgi:hypothetical protein
MAYAQGAGSTLTASRSPSVTFSAAPAAGDVIVLWSVSAAVAAVGTVTGWDNVLGGTTVVASDAHTEVCVLHVVTTAEANANTVTFTVTNLWSTAQTGSTVAGVWTAVDGTTPIDSAASTFSSTNGATPHVLAGLTGSNLSNNSQVVSAVAKDSLGTWTTPAGWTARQAQNAANNGIAIFTRDTLTTAGTNVTATNITPNTGDEYASITVALTEAVNPNPTLVVADARHTDTSDNVTLSTSGGSGITVTNRGANDSGTTDVASVSLSAFTPAADELLIVAAAVEENTAAGSAASTIDTPTGLPAGAAAFQAIGTDAESSTSYQDAAGAWYSQLGPTPAATTIVQAGTNEAVNCWIALAAVTITGHDTTTPLAQAAIKDVEYEALGAAPALSVAFGAGLTVDNVVIAAVAQSVDAGETGAPSPTIGGQSMGTAVATVGANQYMQVAIFARTITGAESNNTVAVAATGGTTRYMHVVFAAEIKKAAASAPTLVVADARHANTVDTVALTQDHSLTVADSRHTDTVDAVALTQVHVLTAADAVHTHTVGAVVLTTAVVLTVADARHANTSDNVVLTQLHTLTVADARHGHTSDNAALTQLHTLTVVDARHGHTVDGGIVLLLPAADFPSVISGNGRYVVDGTGAAWPMIGDAGWGAIANLTNAEQITYLDALEGYGINLVMVSLIEGHYSNNPNGDALGNPAYNGTMFQSAPNTNYWGRVDTFVAAAEDRGITLLAFPAYLGWGTDGLAAEVNAATNAQMQAYGEFVGARYASAPNIIWCAGGDRGDNLTATDLQRTDFMMAGIRLHASQLMSGHGQDETTGNDVYGAYSWFDLNNAYNAQRLPKPKTEEAWAENVGPVFFIEGAYEQDPQRSPVLANGDRTLRVQTWVPFCAGAFGHIFGNDPRWYFGDTWGGPYGGGTWQESLADPVGNRELGTVHFSRFASFIRALSGWELTVPDTTDTFLTAGESTGETAAAARFGASIGKAIVYTVTTGSITLDLTELSAGASTVVVKRYDPTAGTFTTVGSYATTGSQTIPHPGNNAFGHTDWVYLVEPSGPTLAVHDAVHGHTADTVALSPVLTVADARHAHTVDPVVLTQAHTLTVADARHANTADPVTLTVTYNMTVADARHGHTSDNVALVQQQNLVVADARHTHSSDTMLLTQTHVLTLADAVHGHTVDAVVLSTAINLAVADAFHGHSVESVVLTQQHALTVADARHGHTVQTVTLGMPGLLSLADARHGHTVESVTLTQLHVLVVADARHGHTADNVTLLIPGTLVVADARHGHTSDPVTLTSNVLVVADAFHGHSVESATLTENNLTPTLVVVDARHGHTADPAVLTQLHTLVVADARHAHRADHVYLSLVLFVRTGPLVTRRADRERKTVPLDAGGYGGIGMSVWKRVQGDTNDTIDAYLDGVDSLAALTSVTAEVWRRGVAPVALAAEVVDPEARIVRAYLADWITTAAVGDWYVDWRPVVNGSPITWPSSGRDIIRIRKA